MPPRKKLRLRAPLTICAISERPAPTSPKMPTTSPLNTENDMFLTMLPIVTFSTDSTLSPRCA